MPASPNRTPPHKQQGFAGNAHRQDQSVEMQLRLAITNSLFVELNDGRQKFARLFAP
jgi:hypothetical protein